MKELEKTRRISISAILFLLVIVIGLLTYKKPAYNFTNSSEKTLEFIKNQSQVISLADMQKLDRKNYLLIDVRSNFDYSKGHIEHAVNIPKSRLLESEAKEIIEMAIKKNQALIVYGENPESANTACLLLFQLGYEQLKLLGIESFYDDKEFQTKSVTIETPLFDYADTMEKAKIQTIKKITPKTRPQPAKKKVIAKPKKKKKMPEGGC